MISPSAVRKTAGQEWKDRTEEKRTEQNGTEGSGTEQNGAEQKGAEGNGTLWSGRERTRTGQIRSEQNQFQRFHSCESPPNDLCGSSHLLLGTCRGRGGGLGGGGQDRRPRLFNILLKP